MFNIEIDFTEPNNEVQLGKLWIMVQQQKMSKLLQLYVQESNGARWSISLDTKGV